jgi:regulation of enolase protein 1 (concanavalin A-like superfamily)
MIVRKASLAVLTLSALLAGAGARAGEPPRIHLRTRPANAGGVTLLGGPLCSTVTSPVMHQCEDPFSGSLGGQWLMFYDTDYMTLTGKGYFRLRWEWAYFNRITAPTQLVMPTFTDQTGTFLHVGDAEYPGDVLGLDASQEYGQTHLGRVEYFTPGVPSFPYETLPPGTAMPWQNQYFYLDGSVTIHENEGWADYNLSLTPVTHDEALADMSTPIYAGGLSVRPGISYDPESSKPVPGAPADLSVRLAGSEAVLSWTACPGKPSGTLVEYSDGALDFDGVSLMYKTAASIPGKPHGWTLGRLAPGASYSVRVKCYDDAGDSAYSNVAQVTMPAAGALPAAWSTVDIGINPQAATTDPSFGYAGSASFVHGVFQIGGSGSDVWNSADYFRFVYQPLAGDGVIIARVVDEMYTNYYAKAGLMIRETLDPAATNVLAFISVGAGVSMQSRSSTGGGTNDNGGTAGRTPGWVKLQRAGNVFTAWQSRDGRSWTQLGSTTIAMASTVYVGLAVNAHQTYGVLAPLTPYNDFNGLDTATFDHVHVVTGQ